MQTNKQKLKPQTNKQTKARRHIILKLQKIEDKEKNLKDTRGEK